MHLKNNPTRRRVIRRTFVLHYPDGDVAVEADLQVEETTAHFHLSNIKEKETG